jgi:cephalosporin hydroxylase
MNPSKKFQKDCNMEINEQGADTKFLKLTKKWIINSTKHKYTYHFRWLGRPIIQHPQDIIGMQELVFNLKPDLIIETGIAHGGSLVFYASILELVSNFGGSKNAKVLGIDIDIRKHNLRAINNHPMKKRIVMFEGSSISDLIYNKVLNYSKKYKNIMVVLDSNHSHDHVLKELKLYAPLVSVGNYCVVYDTIIKYLPDNIGPKKIWNSKRNPSTAVSAYLKFIKNNNYIKKKIKFKIDKNLDNKLMITACPSGFLLRV